MEDNILSVSLELIGGYEFRVRFEEGFQLLMDEPEPLGEGRGPNAARVLSAAIGNCLSASLLFCLRKAHLEPDGMKTTVRTRLIRNEAGRLRVGGTDVSIRLDADVDDPKRLERCLTLFEDYCIVTQSVRQGIDVQVEVTDAGGEVLRSTAEAGSTAS